MKLRKVIRLEDVEWRYNKDGNIKDQGKYKVLISEETNGSKDLYLGIGWLAPREVHILHHHPDASEFYYILAGSGKVTVGEQVVEAGPGTAIYIPSGDKHKIVNDGKQTMVVLFAYNRPKYSTMG